MKQLIVNADDLGAEEARNAGIFEAIQAGVVTSGSILPNGPGLKDALRHITAIDDKKISFGVHLNLSEGKPLSPGLRLLIGPDGNFLKKAGTHHLLMRQEDPDLEREVVQELTAQIMAIRNGGIRIRHLDGHQHVHVFPAVIRAAVGAAKKYGIPWIRIPEEPCPKLVTEMNPKNLVEEAQTFSRLGGIARSFLEGMGIRTPDHFRGMYLKGRLSLPLLEETLQTLPRGLTELMVHPGRVMRTLPANPFSAFSTAEREQELEALLAPGFRNALRKDKIILIPFPEGKS